MSNTSRAFGALLLLLAACAAASCVRVPPADDLAQPPTVDEIVQRVKCDLYDAFADRLNAPYGYEWLHTWTTQANLNLIVNDQSSLTPSVAFTQPLTTESIPQRVTNAARSWNLGVGGTASGTASRNEAVSFTVSMNELAAEFGKQPHNCDLPDAVDLRSDLGLKEWVAGALAPFDDGYLQIGYHKAPKSGGGATAAKATIAAAQRAHSMAPEGCKQSAEAHPVGAAQQAAVKAMNDVICKLGYLAPELDDAQNLIQGTTSLSNYQVLALVKTIRDIQDGVRLIGIAIPLLKATGTVPETVIKKLQETAQTIETSGIELALYVDPPIDTMSHQVQFLIVLNVNATPNWILLHFKGPANSGPLAALNQTKTHTLNIVIGPPSSLDSQGALAALQISTALFNAGVSVP